MTTDKETPPAAEAKPAAQKVKPESARQQPARDLPTPEQIASWVAGSDLPSLVHLFDQLNTMRFDALTMQIRKEELLPQHWQVISRREIPDDLDFDELAVVQRLRSSYESPELARRRLAALEVAWCELGGKEPALWTGADLLAALRRIIDQGLEADFHDLLSVVRDVWAGLTTPHGRTQLDQMWAILDFVRQKTKK